MDAEEPTNTLMVQASPDAAQSVARAPLCLLSGLAAHQHVRRTGSHFPSSKLLFRFTR